MRLAEVEFFSIGPRLMLLFAVLIALILGGNSLLVWQFHIATLQTRRLAGANQQVVAVLRLQGALLSFHLRLDDLERSRNADALATEAEPLRSTLVEQLQRVRRDLTHLPSETRVDPTLLPSLDAIQATLQSELEAITKLATSGDWVAVRLRLSSELKPLEAHTSALVKSTDEEVTEELTQTDANMRNVQSTIIILVPAMAVCTFLIAASFGWATARRIIELRVEERVDERMRIARELHDTLLQSFQGLMFRLQAVRDMLPGRPAEAIKALDIALERGDKAISEGRDTVADLRQPVMGDSDIAQALTALGEELAAQCDNGAAPCVRVLVEGKQRELNPILRDEIYRIAREALRNAFRHARAEKIEAGITYSDSEFLLHVRDDGGGIDLEVANQGARAGHWGLPGMRERAKSFGGKLEVWSEHGAGTEIELSVPGEIAYGKSEPRRRFRFWRKKIGDSDGRQS